MKKQFSLLGAILFGVNAFAQQAPTNTAPAGAAASGQNSNQFWSRAGNSNFPGTNTNNIFGTLWNSPIYTVTNGVTRMKLNGTTNYTVNNITSPQTKEGYLLIGLEPQNPAFLNLFQTTSFTNNAGAFSQLHITGLRAGSDGYRPWMHTGVTFTDNDDLSYFGTRKLGSGILNDRNETLICWSNDASQNFGFEDMVFRFTNEVGGFNSTIDNKNFITANDFNF